MTAKEVLVVFGGRRRAVTFEGAQEINEEQSNLLKVVKKVFENVLEVGGSEPTALYYFQVESTKWNGRLIDMVAPLENGDTVHLFRESGSQV